MLVICGKDRGRRGKVISVDAKKQTCIVEKINEYKKHQKPKRHGAPDGGRDHHCCHADPYSAT